MINTSSAEESGRLLGASGRNNNDNRNNVGYGTDATAVRTAAAAAANDEEPSSGCATFGRLALRYVPNVAVHAVLVGFTAYVTYISFYKGVVLFSWHPPLMLLGFFVLMTEAILCFIEPNVPTLGLSAVRRKQLHWILQSIGACAITVAFVVIVLNKNRLNKAHFTSWHGIFGLTATVAAGLSMLGGVAALYSVQWRRVLRARPALVRLGHSAMGVLAYGFGVVAVALGVFSSWFGENADEQTQTVCVVLVVLVAVYAVVMPLWRAGGRLRQILGAGRS